MMVNENQWINVIGLHYAMVFKKTFIFQFAIFKA